MDVLSFSLLLGGEVDFASVSICLRLALDVQQADEEGVQQKKELKKTDSCNGHPVPRPRHQYQERLPST